MNLEKVKDSFIENEELSHKEAFLIFENFVETVLQNGKFDDKTNDLYTLNNYLRILKMFFDNSNLPLTTSFRFKMDNVNRIAKMKLTKETKIMKNFGLFFIVFSIILYHITEEQIISFNIVLIIIGVLWIIRGLYISKISRKIEIYS